MSDSHDMRKAELAVTVSNTLRLYHDERRARRTTEKRVTVWRTLSALEAVAIAALIALLIFLATNGKG